MLFETIVTVNCSEQNTEKSFENCISPADVCGGFAVNKCE